MYLGHACCHYSFFKDKNTALVFLWFIMSFGAMRWSANSLLLFPDPWSLSIEIK